MATQTDSFPEPTTSIGLDERITLMGGTQYVLDQIAEGAGMSALAKRFGSSPFAFAKWRDANINPDDLQLAIQVHYDGLAESGIDSIKSAEEPNEIKRGQALVKSAIDVGQFNSAKFRIVKEKNQTMVHLNADLTSLLAIPQEKVVHSMTELLPDASA